ncbi:MAG: T9SS type A sorting domain-containing protein [Flavobacteriales bacterium]|nr:T9SS type A sorting domain-containing protein [Flavobacteriales bacterium]
MVWRLSVLLFFQFLFLQSNAQLQNVCVDSNQINQYYQCNEPSFTPVCGCNHQTYRNQCEAFRNYGVQSILYDGVCQEEFMFSSIYPNLTSDFFDLYVQFYTKSPLTIQVRDAYGKLVLTQNHLAIDSRKFSFDTTSYHEGLYFVFIISGDVVDIQRYMKISY